MEMESENILQSELDITTSTEQNEFFDFGILPSSRHLGGSATKVKLNILKFFSEGDEGFNIFVQYLEIKKVFFTYNTPLPFISASGETFFFCHDDKFTKITKIIR